MAPTLADEELRLLAQVIYLQGPGNASIPVSVPYVDKVFATAFATCINYGSQVGACFIMLLVMLTMTNKTRLSRASTVIQIAALVVGTIRCTLLCYYFTSSYTEFYRVFSGDFSTVRRTDTYASNAATFFSLPQLVLIEAALSLQAYSMVKLWPPLWKHTTIVLSAVIVVCAVAFKTAAVVLRIERTLDLASPVSYVWVIQVDLAFSTATFFWFCFVFIFRIVLHMYEFRSILPPMHSVSAMEVLVMTNGVLMIVPVIFAAMQLARIGTFEAGSLCYTSVVIVLPLGGLVAQSLSHNSRGINSSGISNSTGCSGVSHLPGHHNLDNAGGHQGAYSRATTDSVTSKQRLFSNCSHASNGMPSPSPFPAGGGTSHVRIQGGGGGGDSLARSKTPAAAAVSVDPLDRELDLIDTAPDNHVWVGHEVEVRKELI